MDYNASDTSGTDDDLPPSHQNRIPRGSRVGANERSAVGSAPYHRSFPNMDEKIHFLEQEAYCAVLRAFKAQSDALTWEKEGLITELRKELRVSDDEHRELLTRVNADDIISQIREWRKSGGNQAPRHSAAQVPYDVLPSPILSSRKKQKTSLSGHQFPGLSSKSMQSPTGLAVNRPFMTRSNSAIRGAAEPAEPGNLEALVGRKLWNRWPADNNFYEAVITDYNAAEGRHALIYDMNTAKETWEWVDLKEIPPEDIQWEGEDPGISHGISHGRGPKKPSNRSVGPPPGRRPVKIPPRKDIPPSQNGTSQKTSDDIELLNTDALVKEVETVFNANHPDPFELENAKKLLKDHEQALIEAIAKLAYASEGESDGEHPSLHGQSIEKE